MKKTEEQKALETIILVLIVTAILGVLTIILVVNMGAKLKKIVSEEATYNTTQTYYLSDGDIQFDKWTVDEAEVTAYTSSEDETDDTPHITASGTTTREGIVACPRDLEFGTEVIIEGTLYVCEDRMHFRNDGKYDIWMNSKDEAYEWGRKTVDVKIAK